MESLIKIQPDKERARSLLKLAKLRYGKITTYDVERESSLIAEGYYEVIKEQITALLFIEGYKTLSHKDLIEYLAINHKEISASELELIDHLRKLRNNIVYYGDSIEPSYIKRNEAHIQKSIEKLRELKYGKK